MATQRDTPSCSSNSFNSSPDCWWTYDVFLSFRGKDTRTNFTDQLYIALKQRGLFTFRDNEELEKGKSLEKLFEAIEKSRYVVVVLSRNYANSSWCLKELAKAVECRKALTIFPVFYDVDPSDVRRQTGDHFGMAFSKHEKEGQPDEVQRWRHALSEVGSLSGWHVKDRSNSEVVQEIVEKIFAELSYMIPSTASKGLVGIDSHRKQMLAYLDIVNPEVRIIGIWGMGGIGKTTIAQAVSDCVQAQFDCHTFLENIREVTGKQGVVHLQNQLLSNLLQTKMNVDNVRQGIDVISRRVRMKRVLVVLDDVDHEDQVEALCDRDWFGHSGSRIIITSRNKQLLQIYADEIYTVKQLTQSEALQLFHFKAFKNGDHTVGDFQNLSEEVLKYAKGLPLAIKVLGSFLHGRDKDAWSSALERLKQNPEDGITNVLMVSFRGLKDSEKSIFLDIACSFKGKDRDHVTRILKCDGCSPYIDIEVLINKSLVTLHGKILWMHDLIQELGWEIIRRESRENPEERSRLWLPKDIFPVLQYNEGTKAVQSICLTLPKEEEFYLMNVDDPFSKLRKLRLLRIDNVKFSGDIRYLSSELQLLEWHACPLICLPENLQKNNKLVELIMHESRVKELWSGSRRWSMLQLIDLSYSQYLTKTPNFAEVPNIEILVLEGCEKLVDVHPSIGRLKKLVSLNMAKCKSLKKLPPLISLECLKSFVLSFCSRLKKFPECLEIEGNMKSLFELYLDGTAIEELPRSIGHLTALTYLNLEDCKDLLRLSSIEHLSSLKTLILTGCSNLDDIPENWSCIELLERLDISGTAIRDTSSIAGMKNLRHLSLRGCKDLESNSLHSVFDCWWWSRRPVPTSLLLPSSVSGLQSLTNLNLSDCNLMEGATYPSDLGSLFSLRDLNLSYNNFSSLPDMSQIPKLAHLDLRNCRRLQFLPKLPLSVRHIDAVDCTSLMDFPDQFKVWTSAIYGVTTLNSLISSENQEYQISALRNASRSYSAAASPRMITFSMSSNINAEQITSVAEFSLPFEVSERDMELNLIHARTSTLYLTVRNETRAEWLQLINTGCGGTSIPTQLTTNLEADVNWMGLAVFYTVKDIPVTSETRASSGTSKTLFKCIVRTLEYELGPYLHDTVHPSARGSYYLGILYIPSTRFPVDMLKSSHIQASVTSSNPCWEVQTCEIRLLYQQDVAKILQNVIKSENFQSPITCCTCKAIGYLDKATDHLDKATFEAGWYNLGVDNILRWETSIPTSEEGSIFLLSRNIESLLPRYLLGLNQVESYKFVGSGTSAWFNPVVGNTLSIKLPDNLHKSKNWMGFAQCVALAFDDHAIYDDYWNEDRDCSCTLTFGSINGSKVYVYNIKISVTMDRHQLWVSYFPRAQFPDWLIESHSGSTIRSSFTSNAADVKVHICGFRILYQQDLQGLVQAITQSVLHGPSTLFQQFNDSVTSDWIDQLRTFGSPEVDTSFTDHDGCSCSPPRALQFEHVANWSLGKFSTVIPGAQIPKWFKHISKGNTAEVQLPSNLFGDNNWMGVFVCVYASFHEHPARVFDTPDSEFDRHLFCILDTNGYSAGTLRYAWEPNKILWLHGSDFIFFTHISRFEIPDIWNQCSQLRAEITSTSPALGFHECAIGLVFKDNVGELIQILKETSSSAKCPHCDKREESEDDD